MADKKKKADPGANGSQITDIPHEEVKPASDAIAVKPIVITAQDQIKLEIAKFNVADSAIAQLNKDYGALVIAGVDDKTGYKAVREAWSEVRSKRTGLEKKGLELRNQYKVITTAIGKEEDRLVDLLKPLEESLYTKWKAIDEEKERVKKEEEEREQALLMSRIEELQTLGMAFYDGFYRVGDTISVDVATLRMFPVEQYDKLKVAVVTKVAEIKAAEAEEAERKQKEADELQRQQDELAEKQRQFEEQQRQFQEQQDQLRSDQQEAAKLKQENRTNQLVAIGMIKTGEKFTYNDGWNDPFEVMTGLIFAMEADQFAHYLTSAKAMIAEQTASKEKHDRELEAEKLENERREKYIAAQLESNGMVYEYSSRSFVFVSTSFNMTLGFNDFSGLDDNEIRSKASDVGKTIADAKAVQLEIEEEEAAEKKREEDAALSDKERYDKMIANVKSVVSIINPSEYKSKTIRPRVSSFKDRISSLLKEFE